MAISKIKTGSITADAINDTKIADNAISDEHLDTTAIIGLTELSETANDSDILLIYDASSGTLKKILKSNVALQNPSISSVSPTNVLTGDGTGNATFTITGTRFDATVTAKLITTGGAEVNFDSVTRDSSTQITAVIAISSLSNANEPYDIKVINGNGLASTLTDQININATPVFVTSSGSLGTQLVNTAGSFSVNATDPESAGNVTFELQSGSLPPGYSITNTAAEGGTAIISGTDSTTSSTTTYNFILRAVDAASNTSSRSFSIISRALVTESFTSSGTFSVPSGITSVDVLVVGGGGSGSQSAGYGGGGGAGGLIFIPGYPVTPGGTVSVTVGCGGAANTCNVGQTGQDSVFGTLTAKGGGGGGGGQGCTAGGQSGGSGGGAGRDSGPANDSGSATQPTQPGNSGAYGFGNPGGGSQSSGWSGAGGGGGAGQAGATGYAGSPWSDLGGKGGDGKAYTIADGTTPVYYAGGGGGIGTASCPGWSQGGLGGGGTAPRAYSSTPETEPGQPNAGQAAGDGQANKGGGGSGGGQGHPSGAGGKGVVIVRY